MPEGPECLIMSEIIYNVVGKKLIDIEIIKGRYKKNGPPENFEEFTDEFPIKLLDVNCKGKMIYLEFSNDWFLVSNLGLTGEWEYVSGEMNNNDGNVIFDFGKGGKLLYHDTMSYGQFRIFNDRQIMKSLIDKLGVDVLTKDITMSEFREILSKKKNLNKPIVEVISDQSNFAGIGNYLRSEILYAAKINPFMKTEDILNDAHDMKSLKKWVFNLPRKSYRKNGSGNYVTDGEMKFAIYKQKFDPNGNKVQSKKFKNQTVYWVSNYN